MKFHHHSINYEIKQELTPFDYFSGVIGVFAFVLLLIFVFAG